MLQTRSRARSNLSRRSQGLSLDRQERLIVFLKKAVSELWNSSSLLANIEFHVSEGVRGVKRPAICVFTLRMSLPVEACLTLEVSGRRDLVKVEG